MLFRKKKTMDDQQQQHDEQRLVRPVAPEDLAVGDYVVVMQYTDHVYPVVYAHDNMSRVDPVYVTARPRNAGWPYEVLSICLPFIMVEDIDGDQYAMDLRRDVLARVPQSYVDAVLARRRARAQAHAQAQIDAEAQASANQ